MRDFVIAFASVYLSGIRGYYRLQSIFDRFRKQSVPNSIYQSPRKLNLGSSDRLIPTYTNADALEERSPDIVCDIRKLNFAADNEYDLVRASHVLEHFALEEIPDILSEWRRVLKVGGYLIVCVPNYVALSWRAVLKPSGFSLDKETYQNGWINGVFALDLPPQYRHKIVFTYDSLSTLLANSGFKVIGRLSCRVEEPFTLGIKDDSCDPFSMNIAARKVQETPPQGVGKVS